MKEREICSNSQCHVPLGGLLGGGERGRVPSCSRRHRNPSSMCPGACDEKTADIPSNFVAAISILNVEGDVIHLAMGGWIGRPGEEAVFSFSSFNPADKSLRGVCCCKWRGRVANDRLYCCLYFSLLVKLGAVVHCIFVSWILFISLFWVKSPLLCFFVICVFVSRDQFPGRQGWQQRYHG